MALKMMIKQHRIASVLLGAALLILSPTLVRAQESGEEIFARICKACHTVGQGRLVGPDLSGVTQRRTQGWIASFVKSSQGVIKSGDAEAVALFQEYNSLIMPDNPLSDAEIALVIGYIDAAGGGSGEAIAAAGTPIDSATADEFALGGALFQGSVRLASGGTACNACHHVNSDNVLGAGTLARDLTEVIGRIGAPGVMAILASPPFPVMQRAYQEHVLEEGEIFALVAFLQKLDRDGVTEQASTIGRQIFLGGCVGVVVLLGIYSLIWIRRKRHLVYGDILRRQNQVVE